MAPKFVLALLFSTPLFLSTAASAQRLASGTSRSIRHVIPVSRPALSALFYSNANRVNVRLEGFSNRDGKIVNRHKFTNGDESVLIELNDRTHSLLDISRSEGGTVFTGKLTCGATVWLLWNNSGTYTFIAESALLQLTEGEPAALASSGAGKQ